MSEALRLILLALGFLALLGALGSGPVAALGAQLKARAALAPAIGLALAAALLTSAGHFVSTDTATRWLLLPATLASVAWALWSARHALRARSKARPGDGSERTLGGLRREHAPVIAIAAVGLFIAMAPGLDRGTGGPLSLAHFDVWSYVPASEWVAEHRTGSPLPAYDARYDLSEGTGYGLTQCGCRLGVTLVQSGGDTVFGETPDQTSLPFLAALLALVPLGIWFAARNLGAGPATASLGALFGISPAILLFVADSTLGNLGGLVVVAPLVAIGVIGRSGAVMGRSRFAGLGRHVLAGVLLGGLATLYPEFLLPVVAIAVLGAVLTLVSGRRSADARREWAAGTLVPIAVTVLVAVVISPAGVYEALDYFGGVSAIQIELPRYLSVPDVGAWAFGAMHLYELRRFDELSPLVTAGAILLPLALAACVALGALRGGARRAFAVLAPICVAVALAVYVYYGYGDGHCQYCLFKSLTFILPFLGLGIGLGAQALIDGNGRGTLLVAALAVLAVLALGRADLALTRSLENSDAVLTGEQRGLAEAVGELPSPAPLLLEGMDSTSVPLWDTPQAYYLAGEVGNARISFDGRGVAPTALLRVLPPGRYESPDYRYVVTTFPGLRSGRRLISRHGTYALMRRAPFDVAVLRPGWAFDPADEAGASPWLQGPLQLQIASPTAGPASLRLALDGPLAGRTSLRLGGDPVAGVSAVARAPRDCVPLELERGLNLVNLAPVFPAGHSTTYPAAAATGIAFPTAALEESIRPSEADPIPSPPRLVRLSEARVTPGGCR